MYERQQDYYQALNAANTDGESTVFVRFMLEIIKDVLLELSDESKLQEKMTIERKQ